MKKKSEITIKRSVEDRSVGIYVEADILQKTITVGKGMMRRRFTLWEATRLEFLLKRQIDRLTGNYPKETGGEEEEFVVCPSCGGAESSEGKFCSNCGQKLSSAKKERMALLDKKS